MLELLTHTHTHTDTQTHNTADDGSSCTDMISQQTALSPGLFVSLCLKHSVVCSYSVALNSLRLCALSSDRQFKALAPSSLLSLPLLHPSHHLSRSVSSLPERWACSVSLKRIRGISVSHGGWKGQFSSLAALPPPFPSKIRFFDLTR